MGGGGGGGGGGPGVAPGYYEQMGALAAEVAARHPGVREEGQVCMLARLSVEKESAYKGEFLDVTRSRGEVTPTGRGLVNIDRQCARCGVVAKFVLDPHGRFVGGVREIRDIADCPNAGQ